MIRKTSMTDEPWMKRVAVSGGRGTGLYVGEVCQVGTCCRPLDHEGAHDSFDGPTSKDTVLFHPVGARAGEIDWPASIIEYELAHPRPISRNDHGYARLLAILEAWKRVRATPFLDAGGSTGVWTGAFMAFERLLDDAVRASSSSENAESACGCTWEPHTCGDR